MGFEDENLVDLIVKLPIEIKYVLLAAVLLHFFGISCK